MHVCRQTYSVTSDTAGTVLSFNNALAIMPHVDSPAIVYLEISFLFFFFFFVLKIHPTSRSIYTTCSLIHREFF